MRNRLLKIRFSLVAALLAACSVGAALPVPQHPPQNAVNDYANLLSSSTNQQLEQLCRSLQKQTGFSLVVLTIPSLEAATIEEVATRIYKQWGIGNSKTDEGVLLLLAQKERQVRIETGYGAEAFIPDIVTSQFIDAARGPLSQGDWNRGIALLAVSISQRAAQHYGITPEQLRLMSSLRPTSAQPSGGGRGGFGGVLGIVMILFLVATPMGRRMLPWILMAALSSDRRGGSYGGGGGFGGFGGFGGGMSGGGGSSGRF